MEGVVGSGVSEEEEVEEEEAEEEEREEESSVRGWEDGHVRTAPPTGTRKFLSVLYRKGRDENV